MAKPKSINIADFTNEDLTKLNKIGIYKAWFINGNINSKIIFYKHHYNAIKTY